MNDLAAYAGLFAAAFLAATIFPAQSEVVLTTLLLSKTYSVAGLLAVASVGNVLGSVLNYVLGRLSDKIVGKRWSKRDDEKLARARAFYRKYGRWSLLLSWVPIIGDPITVVAGILREPLWSFLLLVTVAKVGRYLVLAGATLSAF